MSKTITFRLKQYGDKSQMVDVGELVIPDDSPPLLSIEWQESDEKFYRLGKVTATFDTPCPTQTRAQQWADKHEAKDCK